MTQQQYNEAINLIGHLILTASDALIELLTIYGVDFQDTPTKRQLINATVEMLKSDSDGFTDSLAKLVDRHIDTEVESMVWLKKVGFDLPDAEDAFFGGLIKGAIGAIGGLLKKKKRKNDNGSNSNTTSAQALQAKRDLELQIQRMQEQQRRREEERRREEAERVRLERETQAKKRTQTMLMVGGVVVLISLVGVALFMSRSKPPMYNPSKA
ncbi:hypothetical protein ACFO3O_06310 [Dokdonia ponticola]|uniref:Uncharacterized protein n=1 Tax=Dokdonia ponticola TaxID=2041041 RepID=A0ABV9HW17_9FLAO